jgi:hypothetical protein
LYDLLFRKRVLCYRNPIIARDDFSPDERAVKIVETIIKSDAYDRC